ncbi:unnamed protein product, partial [Mesorhabditis spiculigera]
MKKGDTTPMPIPGNSRFLGALAAQLLGNSGNGGARGTLPWLTTGDENDAFYSDDYNGEQYDGNCKRLDEKIAAIDNQYSQTPSTEGLGKVRRCSSKSNLPTDQAQARFDRRQHENEKTIREAFENRSLLHVPMPPRFNFTGAIMDNNGHQGLMHTLLRHNPEWEAVIPEYSAYYKRLSEKTKNYIREIYQLPGYKMTQARELTDIFSANVLASISENEGKILQKQQSLIYDYLRKNITASSYSGEGASDTAFIRIYFMVRTTRAGNRQRNIVMKKGKGEHIANSYSRWGLFGVVAEIRFQLVLLILAGLYKTTERTRNSIREIYQLPGNRMHEAQTLTNLFTTNILEKISEEEGKILQELQYVVYRFLRANVTAASYSGEGANDGGFIQTESPQSDAVPEQLDLSIVVLLVGMFAGCLVMVTLLIVCWMKLPMKDEFEPASEMTPSPSEKRKERPDFD